MKIDINRIPDEGLILEEDIVPASLDLEIDVIKFRGPIKARAGVTKITNAISVDLNLKGRMFAGCGRCLEEFDIDLNKNLKLNY